MGMEIKEEKPMCKLLKKLQKLVSIISVIFYFLYFFADSFSEKGLKVKFQLVMPRLTCSRNIAKFFRYYPDVTNAKIIDTIFTEQSMNFSIKVESIMYRFQIERLPTRIDHEKVDFTVS